MITLPELRHVIKLFWRHVDRLGPVHPVCGQCWTWKGSKFPQGYGQFRQIGDIYAHRIAYQLFVDDIADSLCVLHECDNPSCVNPTHLYLGTHQDNTDDMVKKGRNLRWAGHVKQKRERVRVTPTSEILTKQENKVLVTLSQRPPTRHLYPSDVRLIRKIYRWHHRYLGGPALAKLFGVSQATIQQIVKRVTWKQL